MRPDVVEHLANGPLLADGDVVGRHQPADRFLRVPEERQRDGPFRRREQRQQLAGDLRRQLVEEQRSVVRRHVVEQLGDVLLRHRLQQRFLRVVRQVLEDGGGILPREHAKDDDLVFEAERRQQRGDVARVPIAQHVAQARVVAGAKHRREFLGRPRLLSDRRHGLVTLGTGELLFHLCQRCSDDVVMMHVWTDRLDGVEPQAVNQVEVARCEGGRMGAEVIRIGASAPVINDESNIKGFRLVGSLPGLAQQAGLILGRERRRFADVHVG